MKRKPILLTTALLGVAALSANAQRPAGANGPPDDVPRNPGDKIPDAAKDRVFGEGGYLPDFLQPYDVDASGDLSVEERQAAKEARKEMRENGRHDWDDDDDGELSEEEIEDAQNEMRGKVVELRTRRFRDAADGDDVMTLAEFLAIPSIAKYAGKSEAHLARSEAVFALMDTNGDTEVTLEEFLATLKPIGEDHRNLLRPGGVGDHDGRLEDDDDDDDDDGDDGDDGEEPGDDGEEPGDDGEEPGDDGEEPGDDGEEPGDDGEEPGDDGEEPGDDGEEPGDDGEEPDAGV